MRATSVRSIPRCCLAHRSLIGLLTILVLQVFASSNGQATDLQNRCVRPTTDELKEIYKFRFQTGVNAGGVFLLERWMNGKLFNGLPDWVGTSQDAYNRGVEAIGQNLDQLRARLENIWYNYMPECDFALMAQWGINTIRVPLGYWNLGSDLITYFPPFDKFGPAYNTSLNAIHHFVQMADKYGIGVLLDLHGAPGSQNGADHSGVSGPTDLYNQQRYMDATVLANRLYTRIFKNYTNIVGMEIVNEPRDHSNLQVIYRNAYAAIREEDPEMPVYICDTVWSSNLNKWADFIVNNNWEMAALDAHKYYAFNGGGTPAESHISNIRNWDKNQIRNLQSRVNVVIGEWSNALNPGSYNGYDGARRDRARRDLGAAQLDAWGQGSGWHFWSWRTDGNNGDWDFRALNRQGWYPSNYDQFPRVTRCDADRRSELLDTIVSKLSDARASGLASHQAYWRRTSPNGTYDWDRYTDGFDAGYQAAAKFFYFSSSKIAMRRDFAGLRRKKYEVARAAQGLSNANSWQFRDGFLEGISGFEGVLASAPYDN